MITKIKENKIYATLAGIALTVFVAIVVILVIIIVRASKQELDLSYVYGDKVVSINEADTIIIECGVQTSISVNNYIELNSPVIEWVAEGENSAVLESKGQRCIAFDENEEKILVTAKGKKIVPKSFYIQFENKKIELQIKNTAWTAGNINYYLCEDGTVYIIYDDENNYIKGTYNYVRVDEDAVQTEAVTALKELVEDGVFYQVDIAVSEEYLAGAVFNNDSYVFYLYGDGNNMAIYDGGWGITKEAEPLEFEEEEVYTELFAQLQESASKKTSKKKLGNVANTAWTSKGVNYYFYADGVFESVSIVNHDFLMGKYNCKEVSAENIDEKIVEQFNELFVPKKYYYVTCNVEKEIYNGDNVSVTSLDVIIAQNGLKYALYDSNWNQIYEAKQLDLEARDDFDIFFDRNVSDITGLFSDNVYYCNGVEYWFHKDGTLDIRNEAKDILIKGQYIATDIFSDLIEENLKKEIWGKEFYYIEIDISKALYEKKDEVIEEVPACIYLIITNNDNAMYIYDSYFGTYDDVNNKKALEE